MKATIKDARCPSQHPLSAIRQASRPIEKQSNLVSVTFVSSDHSILLLARKEPANFLRYHSGTTPKLCPYFMEPKKNAHGCLTLFGEIPVADKCFASGVVLLSRQIAGLK
jgi:hypothetical protein